MSAKSLCCVEVAYASEARQWVLSVTQEQGRTISEAIESSGILALAPELADHAGDLSVGVFSQPAALDDKLIGGERIEIYRPLRADPKQKRRKKVIDSTN